MDETAALKGALDGFADVVVKLMAGFNGRYTAVFGIGATKVPRTEDWVFKLEKNKKVRLGA